VVVYHADSLHERIDDCRTDELEAQSLQILADLVGNRRGHRHVFEALPVANDRLVVDIGPNELVKAPVLSQFVVVMHGPPPPFVIMIIFVQSGVSEASEFFAHGVSQIVRRFLWCYILRFCYGAFHSGIYAPIILRISE